MIWRRFAFDKLILSKQPHHVLQHIPETLQSVPNRLNMGLRIHYSPSQHRIVLNLPRSFTYPRCCVQAILRPMYHRNPPPHTSRHKNTTHSIERFDILPTVYFKNNKLPQRHDQPSTNKCQSENFHPMLWIHMHVVFRVQGKLFQT